MWYELWEAPTERGLKIGYEYKLLYVSNNINDYQFQVAYLFECANEITGMSIWSDLLTIEQG